MNLIDKYDVIFIVEKILRKYGFTRENCVTDEIHDAIENITTISETNEASEKELLKEINKTKNKKYTWSENQTDEIWYNDRFHTIEECIEDAKRNGKEIGSFIAIGICEDYIPHVDIVTVLDRLGEDAYEECGEVAENFPYFESRKGYKDADKLQEKMDIILTEWLKETKQYPGFYKIIPLADYYEIK